MPLTVGRVENLFWANNSYKKPNCAPTFIESQEINQRPIIYGFMGGRTHLYGDQWNYAIYKGVYYFLQIEDCKDLEKQHYSYALIRDMWMNMILNHNIEVHGFLSTTNRDEWLEANLNRTYPVLTQPCEVTRLSLVEAKQKLSDTAVIKSDRPLPLILFDIRELREIKSYWNAAASKYKSQLDHSKYVKGDSPIFLFAELRGKRVETVHSWKEYLRVKINEFLDDLDNEELVISKVQSTEGAGRLKEHYCITWKNGGIGAGVENVVIDTIDLEGLEDIVPINPKTLEEAEPTKSINESIFEDIEFPSGYESQLSKGTGELIVQKLRRKIYFPFTQDPQVYGVSLAPHYRSGGYEDNDLVKEWVNWRTESPQRVKLKGTGISELFLLWVDNIDFHLNYHRHAFEGTEITGAHGGHVRYTATSQDYANAFRAMGISKFPDDFRLPYPFYGFAGYSYRDWFFKNNYITPLGFLIFKPFNARDLDGYIWKGAATSKLHYISGLRRSRLEKIESGAAFDEIGHLYELPYSIWTYYNRDNRALNNDNWNRYWFNITNGLDIVLQPNQRGYTYPTRAYRVDDRTSSDYTYKYLHYDRAPWLSNKSPFYSAQRHRASVDRSRRLIDWLIMKTLVQLPITLNEGDYLFNDMEYWVDKYDTALWTGAENKFLTYNVMHLLFALEDYVRDPQSISTTDTNSVVICSTREGDVEIREAIRFSLDHKLHDDIYSANLSDTRTDIDGIEGFGDSRESKISNLTYSTNDLQINEQAVESVNGHVGRRVGYMALKKVHDGKIEKLNEPLPNGAVVKIIAAFLRANGYKLSHDNQAVLYYERKDFNEATDLFFDLKGTEWYAHVKAGKITLIAKRANLFRSEEVKVNNLKENDHLRGLSVVEKINQRCVLNVYTQQRMLNTRFNFNNDKLNLSVKALTPTHKNNPTNYYQMNLRGDFDVIEREILQIQKKELDEQASIIDYTALETLRAQMRRDDRDYDISVARDVLYATEKENEHYRRQKWDLSTQRMQQWMNLGLGLGQGITSMAAGQYLMDYKRGQLTAGKGANAAAKLESLQHIGSVVQGISAFKAVGGAIRSIGQAVVANQIFDERAKRIETDRKFAFKDIAFRSLQIDLRHRDVQEDSIRQLNKLANVYNRGVINDLDAIEEFNKENELENINLTVFTPNKEQLKVLVALKEEYGVDCDIPNAIIRIQEGMSPDVIRFNHLSAEGIRGITNTAEREYLMSVLEMGVRVVDTCLRKDGYRREPRELYVCTNIYELNNQIENHRIMSDDAGRINADLRDEISALKANVDAKTHELDDTRSTIEQQNVRIVAQDKQIAEANATMAKALAEKDAQYKQVLQDKEEEYNRAIKEKEAEHSKVIADKEAEAAKTKAEHEDALSKAKAAYDKALDDAVRAKGEYDRDLQNKDAEVAKAKADYDAAVAKAAKAKEDYEKLLADKDAEVAKAIEERNNAHAICSRALEDKRKEFNAELNKTKAECNKKLADKDAQLEHEKRLEKEAKEELTQQLNDERRRFLNEQDRANALSKTLREHRDELESVKHARETDSAAWDEERKRLEAQVKEWKDKYINRPRTEYKETPGQCQMFMDMLTTTYAYDLKTRENGWDAFLDLVFAIAEEGKWEELSNIDDKLNNVPEMGVILTRLHELEQIPIVQKALEIVKDAGWESYKTWLTSGSGGNGQIDAIIAKVNAIKEMETLPTVHAVKNVMDELNYLTHTAIEALHEKIGENEDLEFFFRDIYPGQLMSRYEAIFGDPNTAIVKKRYVSESKCVEGGGGSTFKTLDGFKKKTNLKDKVGSISTHKPKTPGLTPSVVLEAKPYDFPKDKNAFSYSGFPLILINSRNFRHNPTMAPIFAFEDAYVTRNLENPNYTWSYPSSVENYAGVWTLKTLPDVTRAIEFWKWPYNKSIKIGGVTSNKSLKVIWFKWRDANSSAHDSSDIDQYGNYIDAKDMQIEETLNRMYYLFQNLDSIIIPDTLLTGFKNGTRRLMLRMKSFIGVYERGVRSDNETVSFGKGANQIHIGEPLIDKFLKIIFILHYFYMEPVYYGEDVDDKYGVYGFNVGTFHPNKSTLKNRALLNAVNDAISKVSDTVIDLKLGMLFNHDINRMHNPKSFNAESSEAEFEQLPKTNQTAAFLNLYWWIWQMAIVTDNYRTRITRPHPYEIGFTSNPDIVGSMRLMFRRMAHVKTKG